MATTQDQIRLELQDIAGMKDYQFIKQRERTLRNSLRQTQPHTHHVDNDESISQHGNTSSFFGSRNSYPKGVPVATAAQATISSIPGGPSGPVLATTSIALDNAMLRSCSAQSQPMSRTVSQLSDPSKIAHGGSLRGAYGPDEETQIYSDTQLFISNPTRSMIPRLAHVREDARLDVGQNPSDYLTSLSEEYPAAGLMETYYTSLDDNDGFVYPSGSGASTSPSLASADSLQADTSLLSRNNSSFGYVFMDEAGALPISRTPSCESSAYNSTYPGHATGALVMTPPYDTDGPLMDRNSMGSHAAKLHSGASLSLTPESTDMFRSISSSSVRSTASYQERRAREALGRQIHNGSRITIAPRDGLDGVESAPTRASLPRSKSSASSKRHSTLATQHPQHRRKVAKVFCESCNEYPDGFRGEHELRRHTNSKHAEMITKWVCRDPSSVSIESNLKAIQPLDKCKACISMKRYGAYYNAAAHLRRSHFKKRTARGKKRADSKQQGSAKDLPAWPPMEDLKHWMTKIRVRKDDGKQVSKSDEGSKDAAFEHEDSEDEVLSDPLDQEIEFVTSGNGGAFIEGSLDANTYPGSIQDLDSVDTMIDAFDTFDEAPRASLLSSSCAQYDMAAYPQSSSSRHYLGTLSPISSQGAEPSFSYY